MSLFINQLLQKSPHFVLVAGDDGVTLVSFHVEGTDAPLFASAKDAVAQKRIRDRMQQHSSVRVTILVNNGGQDFRIDNLPPLNFMDRIKLTRQRLRQAFPKAYATASRNLDAVRVMLASLQANAALTAWCNLVPPAKLAMGLLPIESAQLVSALIPDASKGWTMLLVQFQTGGLRQIVLQDGQIVFTRQTPALPAINETKKSAEALLKIIKDTRGYLARMGLAANADLRIGLLLGNQQIKALQKDQRTKSMTFFTPRQAAERLNLKLLPDASAVHGDLVFASWVAQQNRLHLPILPPALQRKKIDAWVAYAGLKLAFAVFILALGSTGWSLSHLAAAMYKNHREATEVSVLRDKLLAEQAAQAPSALPLGRLRAALERQRYFTEEQTEPWDALRQLQDVLDGKARVTNLDWRDDLLRLDLKLQSDTSTHAPDRQTVVQNFRDLAEDLSNLMPGYVVDITRYPFPAAAEQTITNEAASGDASAAQISIRRR